MQKTLNQKIKELPSKPGVYIFKDAKGLILYVGKAINLKNRVRSYFRKDAGLGSPRVHYMITQIKDLDYVVTDNELESLVLENNFIKQMQPKYNVRLRDDKNYLFIKINIKDEIPTVEYDRKPADKNARYFGPYTSAISIKDTLRLLRKIFPYCANKKVSPKPCFYYHIGKCPGVCIGKISAEEYRQNYIGKIIKFLEGKQIEILNELKTLMKTYAQRKQFEKAAKVRDQVFALNRVLERQKLVYPRKIDQDIFSVYEENVTACVNLFIVREGKLIQKENFVLENTKQASTAEIMESFLSRYYLDAGSLPKEILLPVKINESEFLPLLRNSLPYWLPRAGRLRGGLAYKKTSPSQLPAAGEGGNSSLKGGEYARVPKISAVTRGPKLKLMRLGQENAKQYLEAISDKKLLEEARLLSSLKELQRVLGLSVLPGRIEAFDISNITGKSAVGSMVVFDFARPKKEDYRRFKIRLKDTPDDFAMMREMLTRRFRRTMTMTNDNDRAANGHSQKSIVNSWPLPDLILIDGGKGQLTAALSALRKSEIRNPKFEIIGLAKKFEEIFLPGKSQPLILPVNSIAKFLLQRIRDEAHRFAVVYHRKLRSKSAVSSALDQIPGVGPNKKKVLLANFKSLAGIRKASLGELAQVAGKGLAEKIKASL